MSLARSPDGLAHLVAYAERRGLAADVVLAGTELTSAAVEITSAQELRVLRNLMTWVGPAGGADLGRSYRLRTYGALGFAILASRTVADAIALALRFFDLSHAFVRPSVHLRGTDVAIDLDAAGVPDDVRRFVLDRDGEAIRSALRELLPRTHVERRGARLTFPARDLERPVAGAAHADPELCAAVCQRIFDRRSARTGVAGDTRVVILQRLPDGAPMPEVATHLGLSERSLRRHLNAAGTSYRALLDEVRRPLAETLLDSGLRVGEVAARLGYAETAAFDHARARWLRRPR